MNNIKDDGYYLQKIRKDLNFINAHMENVEETDFETNEVLQDSMMFRLIQVSENARKLTDAFKEEHNQVPWGDVYGLRNRIVHDYGTVDLHVVYVTLIKDVPELMNSLGE
jgi:uncharacterized protein with HEPN domain